MIVLLKLKSFLHDTCQTVTLDDTIDNNSSTNQETTETNPSTTDFNIASTSSSVKTGIHLSISEQIIHNFDGKYSMGEQLTSRSFSGYLNFCFYLQAQF